MFDDPSLSRVILDSLHDGLYVCDTDRRIVYWSKSAERITGWRSEEVLGHRCADDILCHIDQDGRRLCGEEFCPLHRSMVTGKASSDPVLVFGQSRSGRRVPMMVSVAPIRDETGKVVGGVETFTDYTESFANLERAKTIQRRLLKQPLPRDERVAFASCYLPHGMIGGDYFAIAPLDADRYGFLLADVMGHGLPSALYTVHLSSLWTCHASLLANPAAFAERINQELCEVVQDESFATALCGVVDARRKTLHIVSAGGPSLLAWKPSGSVEAVVAPGLPFGVTPDADYREVAIACQPGDCFLMLTDGAIEIESANRGVLGVDGLIGMLKDLDYPRQALRIEALHRALLGFSNALRLEDDLTLLEIRFVQQASP